MKLKNKLSCLFLLILCFSLIGQACGQTRVAGVSKDDTFTYSINLQWSSSDPNVPIPQTWIEQNKTKSIHILVTNTSDSTLDVTYTYVYENGTSKTVTHDEDVSKGGEGQIYFIAANLNANDAIGIGLYGSQVKINETITKTYATSTRETNHIQLDDGTTKYNYYYDKTTGILIEYTSQLNENLTNDQGNPYNTTLTGSGQIKSSSIWTIPEFPSLTVSICLIATTMTGAIIYKTKQHKTSK